MKRTASLTIISTLLLFAVAAFAARIFDGYAGIKWGTDMHKVMKEYPKGKVSQLHSDVLYKQVNPNRELAQRIFVFKENKLIAVSVKFNASYVKKTGIEKLLARHKKAYGEGAIDRSGAPHMITYRWEGPKTRVSYAYAPKRPDMTVILFERK